MTTDPMQRPMALVPGFQHYAWGDPAFIPDLFGMPADGSPYAEAWFGAHPRRPSTVLTDEGGVTLDALLAQHGSKLLGSRVAERFAALPYLLKVLAAERPLSIQVHPSLAQAGEGYAREDALGVPLDAPSRNYRDRNHKPELIVALSPFFALSGFRPRREIAALLEGVPELGALLAPLTGEAESLKHLVASYLHLDPGVRDAALAAWLKRLAGRSPASVAEPEYWVLTADAVTRNGGMPDQGLFFFLLLNLIELLPGQGLFLSEGVPHAYLKGAGVEVMANSDNVLRCGLTTKHTDPEELLSVVRFEETGISLLEPRADQKHCRRYSPPAPEFRLETWELMPGAETVQCRAAGPETLLVANAAGRLIVTSPALSAPIVLGGGGSVFVPDGVAYAFSAERSSCLVKVTVP